MKNKCAKGYKVKDGKCVSVNSMNPFKPSDTLTKFFLYATIGAIVISALLGAGLLLFGAFNEMTLKILLTTLTLGAVSLLGLVSGNNENKLIKYAGIGSSVIAGVLWIILIWKWSLMDNETMVRFAVIISIIAFGFAHASILSKSSSKDKIVIGLFWLLIALILGVAGMLIYAIMQQQIFNVGMTFWRILGALAVLDVAGSIALPIVNKVRG